MFTKVRIADPFATPRSSLVFFGGASQMLETGLRYHLLCEYAILYLFAKFVSRVHSAISLPITSYGDMRHFWEKRTVYNQRPDWFTRFENRISWEEFNQNVHIDLVNKLIYFETPKVACSTIKKRLLEHVIRGLKQPKEIHPTLFCSPFIRPFQLPDKQFLAMLEGDEFVRFSFVREPVERVLSAFLDKINRPMPQRKRFLERFMKDKDSAHEITFFEFLSALVTVKSYKNYDKHWRPQPELLLHPDIDFHFIGDFAHFEKHWLDLSKLIGLPVGGKENGNIVWHATCASKKIDHYLTEECRTLIENLYATDIQYYNSVVGQFEI